jgi:hypothetical protein
MDAPHLETIKNRLETVIALARLLERVEAGAAPVAPDQYRTLVRQLTVALSQEIPDDAMRIVLSAHPAAAEVYENMHYAQSGLSRQPLERSVGSEMMASQAIAKAARKG